MATATTRRGHSPKPKTMNRNQGSGGGSGDPHGLRHATKRGLQETAAIIVGDKTADSHLFNSGEYDRVPIFEDKEIRLGKILGRGGFCVVTEIDKVKIGGVGSSGSSIGSNAFTSLFRKSTADSDPECSSNPGSELGKSISESFSKQPLTRDSVAKLAKKRNRKGGRLALKRVAPELRSNNFSYLKGIVDLAMEAKFLAALDHPNIVALCGISNKGAADFIIVERLKETLSAKLKTWTKVDRQCQGITGMVTGSRYKKAELYESKLNVAYDIANATNYLHSRSIIFRDLKPDNIGFDANGTLKLFDFGLAKELLDKDRSDDGLYHLTGMTGAIRYMAPEVGLGMPYNLKADVYSWSMLMWFILALEPPFGFYTEDMIRDRVFRRGSRPAIFDRWSEGLGDIMKRGWDSDISVRPTFVEVCSVLRTEMTEAADGTISTSFASAVASEP